MGRKSREKRERRMKALKEKYATSGISIEKKGRNIIMSSDFSPEQWAELQARKKIMAETLPDEITKSVVELRNLIKDLPTLQLLANLTIAVISINPETYKEYEQERPMMAVEYATWLCLLQPQPIPNTRFINGPEMDKILGIIDKLLDNISWNFGIEFLRKGRGQPNEEDKLVYFARLYDIRVRNPGYWIHQREQIMDLFMPFNEQVNELLGFSMEDCRKLMDVIEHQMDEMFNQRLERSRKLAEAIKQYKRDGTLSGEMTEDFIPIVDSMKTDELENALVAWCWFGMEDAFAIKINSLAQESSVSTDIAKSFLSQFSLSFNQEVIADNWPSRYEPLELRPLIKLSEEDYYGHLATKLVWAVKPNLESELKRNAKLWECYQSHRSSYLEQKTLELLVEMMPGATAYSNLRYSINDDNGNLTEYELDGLVIYDSIVILCECKAGALSTAAQRGAPSFREDIKTLVDEAERQCIRARKYIEDNKDAVFYLEDGDQLTIAQGSYSRIIMMTASLDDLTSFTLNIAELKSLGVLKEKELIWNISLLSLLVISDIIEYGPQFIHYLIKRMDLDPELLISSDELDFFGRYLLFGLDFTKEKATGADRVSLLTHTTDFDSYYLFKSGDRKTPAQKPKQDLPKAMRDSIEELSKVRKAGFVEEACKILDLWKPTKA